MSSLIKHTLNVIIPNIIKILSGFLILKIAAIYLSIEDFGRFGQLMTLTAIINMLAGGGINNGVIKLLSENGNSEYKKLIIQTSGWIWFLSVIVISFAILITWPLHYYYLKDLIYLLIVIMVLQIFWGQANFLNSYLVSYKNTILLRNCGIQANLLGVFLFLAIFSYKQTLASAIIGYLVFMTSSFIVNAFKVIPSCHEVYNFYRIHYHKVIAKKLFYYGLVMIVGATAIPVTQMLLRNHVGNVLGWESVGYWQAIIKISDAHMQFYGIINLSILLPYFSSVNANKPLKIYSQKTVKIFSAVLFLATLSSSILILFSDIIINILYQASYLVVSPWVALQTIGDFLKVLLSLLVIFALAKGYWQIALVSELVQAVFLYGFTMQLLYEYKMTGLVYAYIISLIISIGVIILLLWRKK